MMNGLTIGNFMLVAALCGVLFVKGDTNSTVDNKLGKNDEVRGETGDDGTIKFVTSYAKEKKLSLSKGLLQRLARIRPEEGVDKTTHLVRLTSIIDIIAEKVESGSAKESNFLEWKFSSLETLKDQLENIEIKRQPSQKKSTNQVAEAIRGFVKIFKTNPQLLATTFLSTLVKNELISKDTMKSIMSVSKDLLQNDQVGNILSSFGEKLASIAETEGGEQLVQLLPLLLSAEGRHEALQRLKGEAKEQWASFLDQLLSDTDLKTVFLDQCGDTIIDVYLYVLKDPIKMMMANAFLTSQGLPPIRPKDIVMSVFDVVEKSLQVFTTYKLDMVPLKQPVRKFIDGVEKEYVRVEEFELLSTKEQSKLVARFLDENVVTAVQDMFKAHDFVHSNERHNCAQTIVCSINERYAKQGGIKQKVLRGLSMIMGWLWSLIDDRFDQWKIFEAAESGANLTKPCAELYVASDCKAFEWQSEKMSLDFDHQEL